MEIIKTQDGTNLQIELIGRLDTTTSPMLEQEINNSLKGIENLQLDFAQLAYVSSAGLRVLLTAQKIMNKQGTMTIKNVCDEINEVFQITGFCDILTILPN